ncbi:MAG: PSD1 and planctomycete cytochrome C domain-containing protein [Planctomycetaceae bacterium]
MPKNSRNRRVFLLPAAVLICLSIASPSHADEPPILFERDIVPIFQAYCWKCHGGEARKAELDLRTLPLALAGGKRGAALVRGKSAESLLIRKLTDGSMPPKGEARPTTQHIEIVRKWIDRGAKADYEGGPLTAEDSPPLTDESRSAWAFRAPARPALPDVKASKLVRTPVDAFLLEQLEAKGLSYSPEAEKRTLIRRASFDVIGLPPSPEEVAAFLADESPVAWERLVDRLLASPHYGERWGRHWLDAAGYVDSLGTDNDATIIEPHEGIWKYRDYVVKAINDDKPYDRFLLEQLAGDEFVDRQNSAHYSEETIELLTATGFLRQAADVTYAPELNTADIRNQVVFDTVQIVAGNLMGLTVHCAQCHTHKFDPISHADYYRLVGIFAPAYDAQNWVHSKDRLLPDVPPVQKKSIDEHNAAVDREVARIASDINSLRKNVELKLLETKLAVLAEGDKKAARAALGTSADQRNAEQKAAAEKFAHLAVKAEEIDSSLDPAVKKQCDELNEQAARVKSTKRSHGMIQALWDVGAPPPNYLMRRGDHNSPGPAVEPGVIAILDDRQNPFRLPQPSQGGTTGYRTAFAQWLTRPNHPLTARVIVNRVWQQHFGTGIVATPENFGAMGVAPTHPKLLDWLAVEFIHEGWSLKRLHRLILNSTAYRQSSRTASLTEAKVSDHPDPENHLLWKMPLRRIESEIVRDAVLATSGGLLRTLGGEPIPVKPNSDGSVEIDRSKVASPALADRRSLYVFARRNYQLTELGVFDQPAVATNCMARTSSAVVSQSLALLNGRFVFNESERFAARLRQLGPGDERKQIEAAFEIAFGRKPTDEEAQLGHDLMTRQAKRYREQESKNDDEAARTALANFCQMILNANEFLHVE